MFGLVLIAPSDGVNEGDLAARVTRLMEVQMLRGVREWWTIGGRYDGLVQGEPRPPRAPGERHQLAHNRCLVRHLPVDLSACAVVTPDGAWHEGPTGDDLRETGGLTADALVVYRRQVDAWRGEREALLRAHPDHVAIGIEYGVWL